MNNKMITNIINTSKIDYQFPMLDMYTSLHVYTFSQTYLKRSPMQIVWSVGNFISVFIQIDAHALIDTHPLHHQAPDRQKRLKLVILVSKMHRYMMNCPHICNYYILC